METRVKADKKNNGVAYVHMHKPLIALMSSEHEALSLP